jgi:hypothetical protein
VQHRCQIDVHTLAYQSGVETERPLQAIAVVVRCDPNILHAAPLSVRLRCALPVQIQVSFDEMVQREP